MSDKMRSDLGLCDDKEIDLTPEASEPVNEEYGVDTNLLKLAKSDEKTLAAMMGITDDEDEDDKRKPEEELDEIVKYPLGHSYSLKFPIRNDGSVRTEIIFSKPLMAVSVGSLCVGKIDELSVNHVLAITGQMSGLKPRELAQIQAADVLLGLAPIVMSFLLNGPAIG